MEHPHLERHRATSVQAPKAHLSSLYVASNTVFHKLVLVQFSKEGRLSLFQPGVPQPPSFRAYGTFAGGGALIGTDTRRLFNIRHGAWEHLGGREFGFTFIEELVDVMGNFAGTVKVRVKLTVTDKDEFVGVSNAEERNEDGVVTAIRCGTVRGARIKVEPLAPQCQSITPPQ